MLAALLGYLDILEVLSDKEGGLKDADGRTALMYAVLCDHSDCAKALMLEAGLRDNEGRTAMMYGG